MADDSTAASLPGIAALPPTTARQIGSGQVLVDPTSLVKELIDNALDARAKSVYVDIASDTIDSIQVKDDGHGIPTDDRILVCRRYCTSKIRDFRDLKEVGGTWLGFRGEALSSAAEMSDALAITTRVEGEPVAVKLKYGRDGELIATQRESHPIGTTVKAVRLFERIPVRKQTAIKNAAKCLAKIRRLFQAYALARPTVRLRLHVLKATRNRADFMYAPNANSNVEDAVLKVIGKDCALQCDWSAIDSDGFEIHAFLPKPTATGSKIANQGAFISVDGRPMSCSRGILKQIVTSFKEKLHEANTTLSNVKEPFFCMNIICPPGSYDPNIEPAKDDVMFDDGSTVLQAVRKLLHAYYPKTVVEGADDLPDSTQQFRENEDEDRFKSLSNQEEAVYVEPQETTNQEPLSTTPSRQPQWRSSMYGMDKDDLVHLHKDQTPIVEEDDGRRPADIFNPWTIARMNATIKPNNTTHNEQLLSPAKSFIGAQVGSSSPIAQITPRHALHVEVLTPQTSPRSNAYTLSPARTDGHQILHDLNEDVSRTMHAHVENTTPSVFTPFEADAPGTRPNIPSSMTHTPLTTQLIIPRRQTTQAQKLAAALPQDPDDTWFGQPMRGFPTLQSPRKQHREKNRQPRPGNDRAQKRSTPLPEPLVETRVYSEGNTDIRDFFRNGRAGRTLAPSPSATEPVDPHNSQVKSSRAAHKRVDNTADNISTRDREAGDQQRLSSPPSYTGCLPEVTYHHSSIPSPHRPQTYNDYLHSSHLMRPSSTDSNLPPVQTSPLVSIGKEHNNDVGQSNQNMAAFFKAYQDREEGFVDQSVSPTRRQGLQSVPAQGNANNSRPQRCRTIDEPQRTKSSKLPLEHVLQGHHLQNIVLHLSTSIVGILQSARQLDMRNNSLQWPNPATGDAWNAFLEPITSTTVTSWVLELDAKLGQQFELLPGADVRSVIHETIQTGLDEKQVDTHMGPMKLVKTSDPGAGDIIGAGAALCNMLGVGRPGSVTEEETSEFDMSQFMDFDAASSNNTKPETTDVKESAERGGQDCGDAIDDDMLLDW
ncbi:hypothetical protein DE146DRAFT_374396 [Phaeosphaeria sp. MPI-PUGE-AT-0046c]|nr:hypothetical protein DE146DRAFT_374396 [Phaeosphaeria sp. MPI-PUGE-AT-0046c]